MTFKPGQSGNPNGRPRRTIEEKYLKAFSGAMKPADVTEIVEVLIKASKRGDVQAAKLLLSYGLGTPVQRTEITGANGDPLTVQVIKGASYADLQPDREQ